MDAPVACRNIGPQQRRLRLYSGIGLFGLTGALASGLLARGAGRGWRVLVAAPCYIAAASFFEATDHTCVALARRGLQNLDTHASPLAGDKLADAGLIRQLRRQGDAVTRKALLTTALVTAALLLVPD